MESAAALADDLERWQRGEPIQARPVSGIERIGKWARRRPTQAALLGVGVTFLLTVLFGAPLIALQQSKLKENAVERANIVQANLYSTEMALASGRIGQLDDLEHIRIALERWNPDKTGNDYRGWEWWCLREIGPKVQGNGLSFEKRIQALSVSPDRTSIAISLEDRVEVWSSDMKNLQAKFPGPSIVLCWHPEGNLIGTAGWFGNLRLLNPQTGEETVSKVKAPNGVSYAGWSPSGKYFGFGSFTANSSVWDFENEVQLADLKTMKFPVAGQLPEELSHPSWAITRMTDSITALKINCRYGMEIQGRAGWYRIRRKPVV